MNLNVNNFNILGQIKTVEGSCISGSVANTNYTKHKATSTIPENMNRYFSANHGGQDGVLSCIS
jgi:hypothetical protein